MIDFETIELQITDRVPPKAVVNWFDALPKFATTPSFGLNRANSHVEALRDKLTFLHCLHRSRESD